MIYTLKSLYIDKKQCLCYYRNMMKNQQIPVIAKRSQDLTTKPSVLEQFSLGFEYNKTLQEVKRDVRLRTHKTAKA